MDNNKLTFDNLVSSIRQAHEHLAAQAGKAVNISLTLRNWLIGLHIAEFELRGADRAAYGEKLLAELAKNLQELNISNTGRRQLYGYLNFYRTYPQIVRSVPAQSRHLIPDSVPPEEKVRTVSAQLAISPDKLLQTLSFSHIEQLVNIDDSLKRAFYEVEVCAATGRCGS